MSGMNALHRQPFYWAVYCAAGLLLPAYADGASDEAHVTRIIRDVNLVPFKSDPRPAILNDKVNEGTAVRTGNESRSELTFVDLTITRLGANSVYSFNRAGRNVELGGGSILLRVPKDSGGARITASAVTVGVTGTTLILESVRRSKLIVLEGSARISLRKFPMESASVHGGQMIDVPPGATQLPPVVNINVDDVMQKHPLVTDFPPLPTRDAIYAGQPSTPIKGQPVAGGGGVAVNVPVVGNLIGPIPLGPGSGHVHKTPTHGDRTRRDGDGTRGSTNDGVTTGSKGSTNATVNSTKAQALSRGQTGAKPTPTPSPRRKITRRHGH
jgi:FecR protein